MADQTVASEVRNRVLRSRDRFWQPEDFDGSPQAVAKELSRLNRSEELRRVRRGLYWRGTPTRLGMAPPTIRTFRRDDRRPSRHRTCRTERRTFIGSIHPRTTPRHGRRSRSTTDERQSSQVRQSRCQHEASKRTTDSGRSRPVGGPSRLGDHRGCTGRRCHREDRHSGPRRINSRRQSRSRIRHRACPCPRTPSATPRHARTRR